MKKSYHSMVVPMALANATRRASTATGAAAVAGFSSTVVDGCDIGANLSQPPQVYARTDGGRDEEPTARRVRCHGRRGPDHFAGRIIVRTGQCAGAIAMGRSGSARHLD